MLIAIDVVRILTPGTLAFFLGIALTPILTHYLYTYRMWKKTPGKKALGGGETPLFNELHKDKEQAAPRMGGIIIWASASLTIFSIWLLATLFDGKLLENLNFLSRSQTWIPLFTLLVGSFVGLLDDLFEVTGKGGYFAGGLSLSRRLLVITLVSVFVASWFFFKLDVTTVGFPYFGDFSLGLFFIPFFMLVMIAVYASGVIDGIDGLAGGVFASAFAAYAGIAFFQNQIDLAAFCTTIVGALLAFLWFNIPPARFYMSETGTMGLTMTLATVAFMADSLGEGHGVFALPIIAFPLVITVISNIVQVASKKMRGKKIFLIAPLHHHFEAIGWPSYKVTMRYWVLSIIFAFLGLIAALLS